MKKYLTLVFTIIGVIIAGIGVYYQIFYHEKISLDIKKITSTQLTRPLNIDGLKVAYTFHDTINVNQLWQTSFVIRNTGSKTILGEGFVDKNIRKNYIPINIESCKQLLSAQITNCNNGVTFVNKRLFITQWRPDEYVEIRFCSFLKMVYCHHNYNNVFCFFNTNTKTIKKHIWHRGQNINNYCMAYNCCNFCLTTIMDFLINYY